MGRKSGSLAALDRYIKERAKAEGFVMNRTQALDRLIATVQAGQALAKAVVADA